MTVGHQTRWAYSTMLPSPHGARRALTGRSTDSERCTPQTWRQQSGPLLVSLHPTTDQWQCRWRSDTSSRCQDVSSVPSYQIRHVVESTATVDSSWVECCQTASAKDKLVEQNMFFIHSKYCYYILELCQNVCHSFHKLSAAELSYVV